MHKKVHDLNSSHKFIDINSRTELSNGFSNVWVRVCMSFVMRGCVYGWVCVCVCVGVCMRGCVYGWVL